jgi:hypothetical protein
MSRFLILCLLVLAFAMVASAQEAAIVGTVTDPSGAAVPGVKVTITNTDTTVAHKLTSSDNGDYAVSDLIPGHYMVRAEAPGFKASERTDIVLIVGDRSRVDFALEIGSTQESIKVEANAVAVQTDSGELSDVITGQQVTQIATNGRSIFSLALLIPGAASQMPDFQTPTSASANSNVSFNGMRQEHNLWLIDGGEDLDRGGAGGMDILPSMDAIAEFRALTSNYSPDFGLNTAGTVTMVFKSGTKDFHGTAWEFVKNEDFDAGNYFNNAARQPSPELRLNTYGFNIGGPVWIPRLYNKDRNKTFFFYNMEWRKMLQGGNVNQPVPLASEYPTASGAVFPSSVALHTPYACTVNSSIAAQYQAQGLQLSGCTNGQPDSAKAVAFPNNTIPTALINANAVALLNAGIFPKPNNATGTNFVGGNKLPTNVREEITRIDHQFSDKFWIFGHWVDEATVSTSGTSEWSGDNVPTVGSTFGNPSYSYVVHATYAISPTLLSETALNANGNSIDLTPTGLSTAPSGFTFNRLFSDTNVNNRIPGIYLSGIANYDINGFPWTNKANDKQVREDVSWTHGAHQFKFGGSWALYTKVQQYFGDTQGSFSFNGQYSGNSYADMLLGDANSYSELAYQPSGHWANVSWAGYANDNWRVNSRLTLNLGVRWDGVPHTYEQNNLQSNFYPNLYNPANAAVLLPNGNISPTSPGLTASPVAALAGLLFYTNGMSAGGVNGVPRDLVNDQWWNFGPRVGFAYDLTGKGKTVLRGGYGMMFERYQGNDMYNAATNPPYSSTVNLSSVSFTNPGTNLLTGQTATAPITVSGLTTLNKNYPLETVNQWSIGVQQQLGRESVLTVSYVGNSAYHQQQGQNINLPAVSSLPGLINGTLQYNNVVPYLGYGAIEESDLGENAHYNALQAEFHFKMGKDLTFQAAYTFGKSMDPATGFGGDNNNVSNPYNRAYDNGPSYADQRQIGLVSFVYDLPIFRHTGNALVKGTLGGWEIAATGTMVSGFPLNITMSGSQGNNGVPNSTNRPDFTGSISYPATITQWFSTSGFSRPAIGSWGTLAKGAIYGPGRDNWNISLFKSFLLNEAHNMRFELRVETYNTFNHTQWSGIGTQLGSSNFGQVTSTWDPRTMQFAGKFIF